MISSPTAGKGEGGGGGGDMLGVSSAALKSPSAQAAGSSPSPAKASMICARTEWTWIGKSRRHHVAFEHNTLTGVQKLWLDGSEYFKSSWRYKLTGCIYLPVDDTTVEVYVNSDSVGRLSYALAVDAKIIPASLPTEGGGVSAPSPGGVVSPGGGVGGGSARNIRAASYAWNVQCGGRMRRIEYVYATLDVLVDGVKVEAAGSFAEEEEGGGAAGEAGASSGACYEFVIPPRMDEALLRVGAPQRGNGPPTVQLTVNGVEATPEG